jgi:putative FmdB family regulatory protein
MPIYAYRCEACGHAKDVLQKMSDAQLSVCPACGADAFRKQVTAAGFQLKGSGWYATDFKNNNSGKKSTDSGAEASKAGPSADAGEAGSAGADAGVKPADTATTSTTATSTAAATASPAAAKPTASSSGSN